MVDLLSLMPLKVWRHSRSRRTLANSSFFEYLFVDGERRAVLELREASEEVRKARDGHVMDDEVGAHVAEVCVRRNFFWGE